MRSAFLISLFFIPSFMQCNLPNATDDPALVSNLRFSPSAFDSFRRNTELKYTLKSPATVSIYIIKKDTIEQEFLVKTLMENAQETKGSHSVTWLGDTNQRYFAPIGIYFGKVQIENKSFEAIVQVFHF